MGCCCSTSASNTAASSAAHAPRIAVDRCGPQVRVKQTKEGLGVAGEGSALAAAALYQDRAYFEIAARGLRGGDGGGFSVGVSRKLAADDLTKCATPTEQTFVVTSSEIEGLTDGDVIGVAFDQSSKPELRFSVNGRVVESLTRSGMKGLLYPIIGVSGDANIRIVFQAPFKHMPPLFDEIVIPRDML